MTTGGDERLNHLVEMANDIAAYFAVDSDHAQGVEGVRQHLIRFWAPSMRRKLLGYVREGGDGLVPLAREAVERLDG